MADIFQERYGQSVRCLICARPARRGATLCAQCTAALRRARHRPNVKTEYPPQSPVARTDTRRAMERKTPYSRAARRARAAAAPALGGWGTYATIIAFGLAVCLTGYLSMGDNDRFYAGRSAATAPVAAAPAGPPAPRPAEAKKDAAAMTASAMPSLGIDAEPPSPLAAGSDASFGGIAHGHVAIFESLAPAPRATPDRKAAREGKAKHGVAARLAAKARNAGAEFPAPAAAPVPVAVATPALPESMAPDRVAQRAFALARCERENVIAGLVCKERARLQYCEGDWGVAPECAAAVASLNTR